MPSDTNIGAAKNAVSSVYALYDGNGDLIELFYAKKTDLTTKQDVLPYDSQTSVYGISVSSATHVPWTGVQSKPTTLTGYGITDAATKTELESLAAVVGTANTQLEEIA